MIKWGSMLIILGVSLFSSLFAQVIDVHVDRPDTRVRLIYDDTAFYTDHDNVFRLESS